MTSRPPDPRKLDVAAFASDAGLLEGRWPLADFERLGAGPQQEGAVEWSIRGQRTSVVGAEPEIWLHLTARARIGLECQRCLRPVTWDLDVKRSLRFACGEDAAAALDALSDDDVLELQRSVDLLDVIEDELLLDLPLVPMHEQCPQPLPASAGDAQGAAASAQRANPFAALAKLKRSGATGGG